MFIAPAGFWPRGQNPRRHHYSPRVYIESTYNINMKSIYTRKKFELAKMSALEVLGVDDVSTI